MNKILIASGTGLIGTALSELLLKKGYEVGILSRLEKKSDKPHLYFYQWNPDKGYLPQEALMNTVAVVNLAGKNLSERRWNDTIKKEFLDSRVNCTRTIFEALKSGGHGVKTLINASAIGYYGPDRAEAPLNEDSGPGKDFVAELCKAWENEAMKAEAAGIRVVIFRIGIVLSSREGALPKMAMPVKFYAAAPLGTGEQMVPWIHIKDLVEAMLWAIENEQVKGVYNAVAPNPVSNRQLVKAIAQHFDKPVLLPPAPKAFLKLILGEMAGSVTGSFPVSSLKLQKAGYHFSFLDVNDAIRDVYESGV